MGNIGIMGGTFDPIHNGHLMLGRQAYTEYDLDQIWFMPSGQPPHKKDHHVTDGQTRLAMTQLATADQEGFVCSDCELIGTGNTYTANTLCMLRNYHPEHHFYFIIGADSLYEIEKWHEPQKVMDQAVILVAPREYEHRHTAIAEQIVHLETVFNADIRYLHCKEMNVSSAALRNMVAEGRNIDCFVPGAVAAYIHSHHLYVR